jgi:uncharacterized membrane protein YsdA (DUF1294 family)
MFLSAIALSYFLGHIPQKLALTYFGVSVITYLAYAFDKSKAQRGAWRTQESTLHLFALVGGWPGAAIAQQTLRHKSQKKDFRIVFWVTVFANCGVLAWLMTPNGAQLMSMFK